MAGTRSMEELLKIPVHLEKAIVIPPIVADEYQINVELLDFIDPFFGSENDDPYSHISRFYLITDTFRINQVPDDVVKLILFPLTLKGAASRWLDREPPNSITTWDDLASKFLNRFYPHSKTLEIRKEIINFQQRFDESFAEAWERFKDLMRKCPHHGFSELFQVDIFYNALMQNDQDSLNTAAGGNLYCRTTYDALKIIENKSRVRTAQSKMVVSSQYRYEKSFGELLAEEQAAKVSVQSCKTFVHDDDEDSIQIKDYKNSSAAITPVSSTLNPEDSFIMGDEHLSTITATESGEFNKPSAENLVPIPRESVEISNGDCEFVLDTPDSSQEQEPETTTEVVEIASSQSTSLVPPPDSPKYSSTLVFDISKPSDPLEPELKDSFDKSCDRVEVFSESDNEYDSLSFGDIDYVDDLPSELVSLEEEDDNEIQDEALREKLSKVYLLIARIEALSGNPTSHPDLSIPVYEDFSFDTEETSRGITTSLAFSSPPEYESFQFDLEKDVSLGGDILIDDIFPSLPPKIFENEELILMVINIFLPFLTYAAVSPIRHSPGSEDVVFDPGIVALQA